MPARGTSPPSFPVYSNLAASGSTYIEFDELESALGKVLGAYFREIVDALMAR